MFQAKVAEVEQESACFLLFGWQLDVNTGSTELLFEIRLPAAWGEG